jgi:hypothetical protein
LADVFITREHRKETDFILYFKYENIFCVLCGLIKSLNLGFISLVMGTQGNKLDGLFRALCAIGARDHSVIAFFAANLAIQVNDEEILFNRAGIISFEIALQRLSEGDGIFNDPIDFSLDHFFDGAVYPQGFDESVAEKDVH